MFIFLFLTALLSARCQSILVPPAIPLAVRSPYLQAYLPPQPLDPSLGFHINWPNFWTTNHSLGWCGLSRIDGKLYEWLGDETETLSNASVGTTLNSFQITPTRTILSLQAGPVEFNVTFLSPIEPSDLILQSFPFTYIFVDVSSTDGNDHSVQLYEDITGEWNTFDNANQVQWNTTTSNSLIYHEAQLSDPKFMTEDNNMAEDLVLYHVTTPGPGVTFQTDSSVSLRNLFLNNGTLDDTQDTDYRAISNSWPVFAFSNDLGNISSTSSPVVWGIGVVRDPDIIYTASSGEQTRRPYFFTKYPDAPTAMSDLMGDASNALQRSIALDNKIMSAANGISSSYSDLVSLASRQAVAGVEITAGIGSDGKLNESDILFFMKDIGNSQRTNPIEVLYASLPAFLYLNATWTRYLLEPLLQFATSELYSLPFAPIDLGNSFPSATGNILNPSQLTAIESTSDMLIMLWAHATFTGDGSLLSHYYPTLANWTNTLISYNPLIPNSYVSADTLDENIIGLNFNITNLAIKGIFAINTMAEISRTLGATNDYNKFSNTASSMLSQWQNLAAGPGHLTSTYSVSNSWGLLYNLYPDKLFGFNFVNQSIYDEQTSWYANVASTPGLTYGMPFDSQFNAGGTSKSHWTLFTAATVTDPSTRDLLVSMVYNSATDSQTFNVFPTTYSPSNNSVQTGQASPAQGAMFALLALNLTKQTITGFSRLENPFTPSSKKPKVGAIVGGVIGGAVLVALLAACCFVFIRRHRQHKPDPDTITPYIGNFSKPFAPLLQGEVGLIARNNRLPPRKGQASTPGNYGGTSGQLQDDTELRAEVENIRRQIEEMRSGRYQTPPGYR